MKRGKPPARKTPMRRESDKRRRERPERARVVEAAKVRDEGCVAAQRVPGHVCGFYPPDRPGLEAHEVKQRGVNPGGHLDLDNIVMLCPAGHDLATVDLAWGRKYGLRKLSYE